MNRSNLDQFRYYVSAPLVLGAATVSLATWACFGLGLSSATAVCVYLIIIVLLSLMDFASSLIFSIIAVGCIDFFFQAPLFDLRVESAQDLITLSAFLTALIITTSLVRRLRRLGQAYRDQAGLLDLTRGSVPLREPWRITMDNRRERARRAFEDRLYRNMMGEPRESSWKLLVALFTEDGYLARFVRRRLRLSTPIDTHDRRVLEQIIFPGYLADPRVGRVLFVGCEPYTAHYERQFFASHDFWTIEPNPKMRRYGSKQHVIAVLEQLADHFQPGFFNLIVCNGVYGWGLDSAEQCEIAFANCFNCLAPGGHLLIGWDDIPTHRASVQLPQVASLSQFNKFQFPALGSWRYVTDTPYRHIYEFYQRPS
jgi:SAM-dependent methyltransferase